MDENPPLVKRVMCMTWYWMVVWMMCNDIFPGKRELLGEREREIEKRQESSIEVTTPKEYTHFEWISRDLFLRRITKKAHNQTSDTILIPAEGNAAPT